MTKGRADSGTFLDTFDSFAGEMPKFNIEGKKRVGTCFGFILTLILIMLMTGYTLIRGYFFVRASRPSISSYTSYNARGADDRVHLLEHGFHIAFAVERIDGEDNKIPIDDPNFVEWVPHIQVWRADKTRRTIPLPYHKCDETDYSGFHPIVDADKAHYKSLKDQGYLMCLNQTDPFGEPIDYSLVSGGATNY